MLSSETGGALEGFVFEQLDEAMTTGGGAAEPAAMVATHELADVREIAHQDGFAAGRAEGLAAGREEAQAAAGALAAALDQSRERLESDAALLEWQAVELALQLADKVVGAALEVQPELVLEAVRGGLRRLVDRERVTVLVNPSDLPLVRDALDSIAASLGGIDRLDAESERRVGRGEAMLTTPVGQIDMRIDSQLERAREILLSELATPEVEPADGIAED